MFTRVYDDDVEHDESRTLVNCRYHSVMWYLISCFVTHVMATHGFLMVVGKNFQRVARVVTYIESLGGPLSKVQSMHEDFCNAMAGFFQHEFGFSVLVSCLGGSIVDIIEDTYGQPVTPEFERQHFKQIRLKQGQGLIMGSGLRHRGMAYSKRNVRLFLAFLAGKSEGASFSATYNVQGFKKVANTKRSAGGGGGKGQQTGNGKKAARRQS